MHVRRFTDGVAYARVVLPFLQRHEAVNCLAVRIVMQFADGASPVPAGVYLAAAFESEAADAGLLGAAMRTPPYSLALAFPSAPAVPALLADALGLGPLPGVIGAAREAADLAARWAAITGGRHRVVMALKTHRLERVRVVCGPGRRRAATMDDSALLTAWEQAFLAEAAPHDPPRTEPVVLDGLDVWEIDGSPVAVARGQRISAGLGAINAVYTPPAYRRRGYATSLVAAVSARLLAEGCRSCALFTDSANPTSNAIYRRIGYEPLEDFENIAFTAPAQQGAA